MHCHPPPSPFPPLCKGKPPIKFTVEFKLGLPPVLLTPVKPDSSHRHSSDSWSRYRNSRSYSRTRARRPIETLVTMRPAVRVLSYSENSEYQSLLTSQAHRCMALFLGFLFPTLPALELGSSGVVGRCPGEREPHATPGGVSSFSAASSSSRTCLAAAFETSLASTTAEPHVSDIR